MEVNGSRISKEGRVCGKSVNCIATGYKLHTEPVLPFCFHKILFK